MKNKQNTVKYILWKINYGFSLFWKICLFFLFRIFPIQKNKVVISSFNGRSFGDNAKYIVLELLKQNRHYDIVWLLDNKFKENFPKGVRTVKYGSVKSFFELSTAKIWIDNQSKDYFVKKRKKQFYIQTWHGSFGIKKIGILTIGLDSFTERVIKKDSKMVNLYLSNGRHMTEKYIPSMCYTGEILECGSPRNDILVNKENTEHIKESLGLKSKKICLYAPTFRHDFSTKCYDIDFKKLKETLCKKFNSDFEILIRLHPLMLAKQSINFQKNEIIDASFYPDSQELLAISDFVITDYSSIVYDFMFTKRPIFIYASDISSYERNERGLYFSLKDTPFPLAENNNELQQNILKFDNSCYNERLEDFILEHGVFEHGTASDAVAKRIKKEIYEC